MSYHHQWHSRNECIYPPGKVVCIGRNYVDHIKELNNEVPDEPLIFIKPSTSLTPLTDIRLPENRGECHHEAEIAILIGETLTKADEQKSQSAIVGFGLALDLTLRELQSKLKQKGQPWEKAKAFDGSCPISEFVPSEAFDDLLNIKLQLSVNGEIRQQASSSLMMTPIVKLLSHISEFFTLLPGDVVLTGTPAGVAPLKAGDALELLLDERFRFEGSVSG